jgi:uncharacterized protein
MKIAIISDTHGNVANFKKVVVWLNAQKINLILHCGDIGNPESLKESLENFQGELLGVFGNMDSDFKILIEEYNKIKKAKISEKILETKIANKNIAVTHKPEDARKLADSGKFDLVFYGHTHKPWEEKIKNCRMINPGELAGQIFKPTFAIYDTEKDFLELKILENL